MSLNDFNIRGNTLLVNWTDLGGVAHTIGVAGVGRYFAGEGLTVAVGNGDITLARAFPSPG
jgi:hypothetical protein